MREIRHSQGHLRSSDTQVQFFEAVCYLKQNFPALTAERCPSCGIHCLMRA
jgi:hypothetical protein